MIRTTAAPRDFGYFFAHVYANSWFTVDQPYLARTLSSFRMHMAFRHNSEASSRVHNENPMSAARHPTGKPDNATPQKLAEK